MVAMLHSVYKNNIIFIVFVKVPKKKASVKSSLHFLKASPIFRESFPKSVNYFCCKMKHAQYILWVFDALERYESSTVEIKTKVNLKNMFVGDFYKRLFCDQFLLPK